MEFKKNEAVDEYILQAPSYMQDRLNEVRRFIFEIAPESEEMIRSKIPSYNLYGRPLVYFASQNGYIGFYSDANIITSLSDKLKGYGLSKAGVHLPVDQPIPYELVKEMIILRMADIQQKTIKNPSKKK